MKQKYLILDDKQNKQFKIQEFAELDKEMLSLLCEEAYDYKKIKSAISGGKNALIAVLRTKNLYPPSIYVERIADALVQLHKSKDKESVELFFDNIELLTKDHEAAVVTEELDDDSSDLDELLEDDFDDSFEGKDDLKKMDSSLKIEDDDYGDADDDR